MILNEFFIRNKTISSLIHGRVLHDIHYLYSLNAFSLITALLILLIISIYSPFVSSSDR